MVTNKLINLIGLQRNGCHAVANWLLNQSNLIKTVSLTKISPEPQGHGDLYGIQAERNFWLWNQFWFKDQEPHALKELASVPDKDIETAVIVYEVAQIDKFNTQFDNMNMLGDINATHNVIVLRDFCNMAASFYQIHKELPPHIAIFWYHRALEITGKTNYIPNSFTINYNKWFADQVYRKEIADKLSLDFTDKGIEEVLDFGKGSSFDLRTRNGSAQTMNVNGRWKQLINDPGFVKILRQYQQLIQISKQIFGAEYGP